MTTLELLDDGQVRITFEEGTRLLRRPKFGEYRDLRVLSSQLFDDLPQVDQLAERERALEDRCLAWWAKAAEVLADEAFPADRDDQWPIWMTNAASVTEVTKHWRSVPLARGGKA